MCLWVTLKVDRLREIYGPAKKAPKKVMAAKMAMDKRSFDSIAEQLGVATATAEVYVPVLFVAKTCN